MKQPFIFAGIAGFLSLLATSVFAQSPPPVFCSGIPGCGGGPANILFAFTIPESIRMLANIAAGGAIIAIMAAGAQMMLAFGDEGKTTNARWAILYALGGLALAVASQTIVAFVASENYGQLNSGGDLIVYGILPQVVRIILILVNVTFTIVIMIAGIMMVTAMGSQDQYKKGVTMIKWAIIGAIVMNVARALVEALVNVGL